MAITGSQSRAARALLGWDRPRAATESDVAPRTIGDLERQIREPLPRTLDAIRRAYEAAGISFIDDNGGGRGVRFTVPTPEPVVSSDDEGEGGSAK